MVKYSKTRTYFRGGGGTRVLTYIADSSKTLGRIGDEQR